MRKKTLLLVIVGLLATASAAFAAWNLFTGVNGSGQGTFGSTTTTNAITLSNQAVPPLTAGDSSGQIELDATNNNPNASEQIVASSLQASFTTKNGSGTDNSATCAQYLSATFNITGSGTIPVGFSGQVGWVTFTLAQAAPVSCANGSWAVTYTGTSNP